jgi:hypothetical protein
MRVLSGLILTWVLVFFSCQKEETMDPFEDVTQNQDTVGFVIDDPEPASFAGIYQNVFRPTCANVGCHDGTFEPDFRTMESAYNTLVFQEPIKNDGSYTYRVVPGDLTKSVLIARLENTLSPPMPIQVEPDSDWFEKGDDYIEHIKQWVANGALDIAGNRPSIDEPKVKLAGAEMKYDTLWLQRKNGAISVPDSTPTPTLYFSFKTGAYTVDDLSEVEISFSPDPNDFTNSLDYTLTRTMDVDGRGLNFDPTVYTHSLDLEPKMQFDTLVEQWFFRINASIDNYPSTTIPNEEGIFYLKNYMSFVWN